MMGWISKTPQLEPFDFKINFNNNYAMVDKLVTALVWEVHLCIHLWNYISIN